MGNIDRGSWIAQNDSENCERFRCPFCGEIVYIKHGYATYPTCPYCLTDMPEAEDFDTPEELRKAKWGNKGATNLLYCEERERAEKKKAYHREYYRKNRERMLENQRRYDDAHKEQISERNKRYYQEHKAEICAQQKEYHAEHREEYKARSKAWREAHPDKVKEYRLKTYGKPMREVTAHILGIPVEDVPKPDFVFGKGARKS